MRKRHWSYQGEKNRAAIIAMHLPCAIGGVGCEGYANPTVDHIIPHGMDGPDIMENLRPACKHCNSAKGRRMTEEATQRATPFFRDSGYRRAPLLNTPPQRPWDALSADDWRKRGPTRP